MIRENKLITIHKLSTTLHLLSYDYPDQNKEKYFQVPEKETAVEMCSN